MTRPALRRLMLALCLTACAVNRDPMVADNNSRQGSQGASSDGSELGDFSGGPCSDGDPTTFCGTGAGELQDDPACSDRNTATTCPDVPVGGGSGGGGGGGGGNPGDGIGGDGDGDGDGDGNLVAQDPKLWGPCAQDNDCLPGHVCGEIAQPANPLAPAGGPSGRYCAAACIGAMDCPPVPSGNAQAACASQRCELNCGGSTCPNGMQCISVFLGTPNDRCAWL